MLVRHFFGSVLSCVVLSAVLLAATMLSAAPPILRPSDGAPGEGGPLKGAGLELVQNDDQPPKQSEPDQSADAEAANEAAASEDDDSADEGVSILLDGIDHLAPVDKAWQSAWQRAVQAARRKNWARVVQQLAPITGRPTDDGSEDAMIRLPDGTLRSAGLEAARLLLSLPDEVRAERSRRLKASGEAALQLATERGDLKHLQHVAIHFAGTPAGDMAADQLISLLTDRGHFGLAAVWAGVLSGSKSAVTGTDRWKRRAELISEVLARSEHRRPGHRSTDRGATDRGATESPVRQIARLLTPETPEALSEWSVVGGNVRRHSVAEPATPTLVRRWSAASTSDAGLAARIDQMIDDLTFDGRSSVPVGVPLFVNGRIALRTLRGIEVRDVRSGKMLWTAGERRSLERLLGGADLGDVGVSYEADDGGLFGVSEVLEDFEASDPTGGALGQALFQNATYGFLSSDGERLFAILDDPVYALGRTSVRNRNGRDFAPEPGSASANQLEAFDLETGHLQWRLGGPETGESAGAPLAGWFFLGVPLATNDGLFVVAQNAESIRLFCLEAETGRVRWSQRVGWSDDRLDRDLNRRLWAALPSLASGVLVCPTSAGWVIGVDSLTGTLLWGHRFSKRVPESGNGTPGLFLRNRGMLEVANRRVDSQWVAAPPVIAGTSVLLTPPETSDASDPSTGIIVCLDLFSGRRLWELPRRDANQLAVVTEDLAILAGSRSLDALTLDGRPAWRFQLPDEAAQISGRVLASGDTLFVPTQAGEVLAVGSRDGKLRQRWPSPQGQRPPGSLYSYEGMLISVHPAQVTAFELQQTLEEKLRRVSDSQSPQLLIQRAQLALARGNAPAARQALQGQTQRAHWLATADEGNRTVFDTVVLRTASELRRTSPEDAFEFLRQTPLSSESLELSGQRMMLEVELLLQSGRRLEAFRRLMNQAVSAGDGRQLLARAGDTRLEVSLMSWFEAALADVWNSLPDNERTQVDTDIRRLIDESLDRVNLSADPGTLRSIERLAQTLAFHSDGQQLLTRLAREAEASGRASDAARWWSLAREVSTSPELGFAARLQTALHAFPLLTEAERAWLLATIAAQISQAGMSGDESISRLFETATKQHRELTQLQHAANSLAETGSRSEAPPQNQVADSTSDSVPVAEGARRSTMTVELQRLPGNDQASTSTLLTNGAGESVIGPRFSATLKTYEFEGDRLNIVDRVESRSTWSVLLGHDESAGNSLVAKRVGSLLLVLQGRRLSCLSIMDRRRLWSLELPGTPWRPERQQAVAATLLPGEEWLGSLQTAEALQLDAGSGRYLCCRTERELLVIETWTGRLCWRRRGLLDSLRVAIEGDTVVLLNARSAPVAGYRIADGRPHPEDTLTRQSATILRRDSSGTVTVDTSGNRIDVQRSDGQHTIWKQSFPADANFRAIGDATLVVMKSRGHFETLDLRTGAISDYPRIPAGLRVGKSRVVILPDADRWLLLLQGDQITQPSLGGLQAINAQGTLVSFDRDNPEAEPWSYESGEVSLPFDELSRLPFLLLMRETGSPLVPLAKTRHLTLLDRRTGRPAVDLQGKPIDDLTMPGTASFSSIAVSDSDRHVELQSGTERLRLTVRQRD